MRGVTVGKWCVYTSEKEPSLTGCRAARASDIQERDNTYIGPSFEAACEKQRSSKILLNRGKCGTGKAKSKWSLGNGALPCHTIETRNLLPLRQALKKPGSRKCWEASESHSAGSSRAQQEPQQTVKKPSLVRIERMRRVYYLLGSTKFSAKSQHPRNETHSDIGRDSSVSATTEPA